MQPTRLTADSLRIYGHTPPRTQIDNTSHSQPVSSVPICVAMPPLNQVHHTATHGRQTHLACMLTRTIIRRRGSASSCRYEATGRLSSCVPHNCHCGTLVYAQGLHAMVCKKAPGKIARHHTFSMTSFGEPSVLLGSQLSRSPLD